MNSVIRFRFVCSIVLLSFYLGIFSLDGFAEHHQGGHGDSEHIKTSNGNNGNEKASNEYQTHAHHHRFEDADRWAKLFEKKERDAWQEPERIIKELKIKDTDIIADIGSATGYFPVRFAKAVPKGRVWGIDIEPNLVNYLNNRAKKEQISNLFSILGTKKDPMIPEPVDLVLTVNTYHHIYNRVKYFKSLEKRLKPGGRVVIIDFKMGKLPVGPKDKMKIPPKVIIDEMKQAGYSNVGDGISLKYQNVMQFKL